MRILYSVGFLLVVICCQKPDGREIHVNFQQKSFSEILNMAQNTETNILVDFWADG